MSEWIRTEERMPEKDGRYLVVEDHFPYWVGISSLRYGKFDCAVSYWQELPPTPKKVIS